MTWKFGCDCGCSVTDTSKSETLFWRFIQAMAWLVLNVLANVKLTPQTHKAYSPGVILRPCLLQQLHSWNVPEMVGFQLSIAISVFFPMISSSDFRKQEWYPPQEIQRMLNGKHQHERWQSSHSHANCSCKTPAGVRSQCYFTSVATPIFEAWLF